MRDPRLAGLPLAVYQKHIVVTCNYIARDFGIQKLMLRSKAKQICPNLKEINGEDLTPYRKASEKILQILNGYGVVEKVGLDEAFVDITNYVSKEDMVKREELDWCGHVLKSDQSERTAICAPNRLRPMDLRETKDSSTINDDFQAGPSDVTENCLRIGSNVAFAIRKHILAQTGFKVRHYIMTFVNLLCKYVKI